MVTITYRRFLDTILELRDPVEVVRRTPHGTVELLGRWLPLSTAPPTPKRLSKHDIEAENR